MGKDPATLWYWNDWQSGTILMSRFLKGCYMDLLHAQFNHGSLSLEEVKTILGSDFGSAWPTLQKKFKEVDGKYFNERLEDEKEKRKKHSQHQRDNVNKRWDKYRGNTSVDTKTIPLENEIENENKDVDIGLTTYNAEKEILNNMIWVETICMKFGLNLEEFKRELNIYHLNLEENNLYPKTRKSVYAGIEKRLVNNQKFNPKPEEKKFISADEYRKQIEEQEKLSA